ncbi:hypothetical protein N2152v2_000413 [Parachlorella kessleri]
MGILISRLFNFFGDKEARILVLGLDNAGKTTILSIGFNVETVTYKNIKFQVWDLGGQTSIRPYWRCYYPNTQAIIYVVDSCDVDRLPTSREEFQAILEEEELKDAVILVYANKQVDRMLQWQRLTEDGLDLPGALTDAQVAEGLGLTSIKNRDWFIVKTSAIKGEGLFEGLDWLSNTLKTRHR